MESAVLIYERKFFTTVDKRLLLPAGTESTPARCYMANIYQPSVRLRVCQ